MKLLLFLLMVLSSTFVYAQENIIFDTDMGSDCDDAGAMAVLHKLADKGEVNILGVIFSSNANKYGIGTVAAINAYYGRQDLPLGQFREQVVIGDPGDSYSRFIAEATAAYGHHVVDSAKDLVLAYKEILEVQADQSVSIVTVGHPVGLHYLIHDKEGSRLVKQKVKRWIAMTHTDTLAQNDWNFGKNGTAPFISGLLKAWPTEIYFSGAGKNIITGHVKLSETPENNPVKKAYALWGNNALKIGRSSWDQIAVLFAARPQYFDLEEGSMNQNSRYETFWTAGSGLGRHFKITPKISRYQLESIIEGLMHENPL